MSLNDEAKESQEFLSSLLNMAVFQLPANKEYEEKLSAAITLLQKCREQFGEK